ncbi:MAG: hypothetical protein CSA95_01415 [Bacteroidetes bacterium]|nr:MAG: hypothetical protein CSA95_01415 [Bacteroidota bacterium]PIE87579.1 MAG: hypothetical protein CSA04_06140 [Bacteroidota bacterium]
MENFKRTNNVVGWVVFAIATLTYFLTLEPTASWWDCGEYIATAYKLQVGHPPGAPLFQLLGRFFALFAFGNEANVAKMINVMSALSSSFTILFLFWSITMLAQKIFVKAGEKMSQSQGIIVLGAGVVGALAFTFSDSFWFSAVEGEVYAMSTMFTALVFWAILRWERVAHEEGAERWLLLIAFLVGLSIGVHLLNLLAIPAIALIYYFKKFSVTPKGTILTILASFFLIAFIMYGIIPMVVKLAGSFELFFVNTLGLPFNTGTVFYLIFLLGLLVFGVFYTIKKRSLLWNNVVLSLIFILIGYSSFLMLVIRANTNTPINENSPDNAINLLSYLNRDQYGDWPIFYGAYWDAPLDANEPYRDGNPVYVRDDEKGRYVVTDDKKGAEPNYDKRFKTLLPRMWYMPPEPGRRSRVEKAYRTWGGLSGRQIRVQNGDGSSEMRQKPTFGENLTFFFRYQVSHMYMRYFMWNFSGRQNDIEGHGGVKNGNWITGINGLDRVRLGEQSDLPSSMKNPAHNKFYMLPLLLGIVGILYQLVRDPKGTLVVGLLFLMTGLAIIVYLNQYPFQPRERDYAYAGSFMAFSIWIGFGVMAVAEGFKKIMGAKMSGVVATLVCLLLVPGIMAKEGWDDHDRSGKYAARDFAANYLNSCAPNAILITNGDNDTFPLWYAQEVEGIRTDVRVVNFMLSSSDWYSHQLARKIYDSEPLPFTLTPKQYDKGVNEIVPYYPRVEERVELKKLVDFVASEGTGSKLPVQGGKRINFFPTKKVKLTVDKEKVLANGIVPPELADEIVDVVEWDIKSNYLYKNDLVLLDFLATNDWSRPIYFSNPGTVASSFDVDKYCQLEGFVYRFMPVKATNGFVDRIGGVNPERSYEILMEKCSWGGLNKPDVVIDRESARNSSIPKQNYYRVAQGLLEEGEVEKAVKLMDRGLTEFPHEKFPFDYYTVPFVQIYYMADEFEKGDSLARLIEDRYTEDIDYYLRLSNEFLNHYEEEMSIAFSSLQNLSMLARQYDRTELADEIEAIIDEKISYFR